MKISKRQLQKIIKEERARLREGRDYDLEDDVSYFITAGPAEKAIKYLEKLIKHAEAGGEVDWKMAMNSHEENHTSLEYAKKRLEMLNKGSGIGSTHQFDEAVKVTKRQLQRIIREETSRVLSEDRASRLNITFDVMGDTPQFKIQQSGYDYDLTEYSRGDFESFVQEFETDHGADMPEGQVVHDAYGLGFPNDVLPLREAWNFVFDVIESM